MSQSKKEKQEVFEEWVFVKDDALADFFDRIPAELNDDLDFSPASLDTLEKYILKNFTAESIEEKENMDWLDGFARYIGETFIKNLKGAHWSINLEKEDLIYYGLPLIVGAVNQVSDYCPHMDVVAALHRQSGNFVRTLLEKAIARQK
jgi:hypothetical protein